MVLARLGVAVFAAAAALAQQPKLGTVVYERAPDGAEPWPVQDVYSMSADGSNVRALTTDGHSHDPAWSPDGRRIIFIHDSALSEPPPYREAQGFESYHPIELHVMDADGKNACLLRRIGPVIETVAWSPDGKWLAFAGIPEAWANRNQPNGEPMRGGLFLLPASGEGEPRLLLLNAFTPAWSPDGKKVAFSLEQPRGRWSVHVANADGSNDRQLTDPDLISGSPKWSPDGKLIAFDQFLDYGRNQQVFVMNADGSHTRQITADPNWSCGHPSWSQDGRQVAFGCRSSAPCNGVSSVGTRLPLCDRRIFVVSPNEPKPRLVPLNDYDGAAPEFSPSR